MALGSLQKAQQIFQQHDFSRSFQVRILNMNGVPDYVYDEIITKEGYVYAKTYNVPGRSITDIQIPYQGFNFHIPGQVAYDQPNPWTITFKTAGDYLVRNALERWHFDTINDETSCGNFGMPCADRTIDIAVLAPSCEIMRVYRLHGVYIQHIGPIQYNMEGNEGTEFEAGFHYQYWRPAHEYELGDSNVLENTVDGIFQSYESRILNNTGSCKTTFTTPKG